MAAGRLVVGIDLGTTHTVVASAPRGGPPAPEVFAIPQLVTASEVEARPLLPSCLFAPLPGEVREDPFGDAPWVVGEHARRRGTEVPGRLVASAKSWLSHARVDREAPILPWGSEADAADVPRVSPVEASTRLLAHVRTAWDAAHPDDPLDRQLVVLTVPASFDEDARELTLEAATRAGLSVRLLEEPQAAFYDWLAKAGEPGLASLFADSGDEGALVLVCDVGGGTTDLSLLRARASADGRPEVARVAVGQHLLLGGDNMDLALAHLAEPRITGDPATHLDPGRFGQLVSACRGAKERLLAGDGARLHAAGGAAPDEARVTVLGGGSRLVGAARSATLRRDEVERAVLDGFLPRVSRDERPDRSRAGLVAFGLPYERDPAITRHVAAFFARHAGAERGPAAVLLNGGVFRARAIAARLLDVLASWGGPAIAELPHADPDLAVARGAVAYGLALEGRGVRIRGGSGRGYYVGVDPAPGGAARAVCVVPRGAEEGSAHRTEGRTFALVVGRPVRFDLWTSDAARHRAGDVVTIDEETFQKLPPVAATFEAGAATRGAIETKVAVEGELTAVGTLDLACVEVGAAAPRRFRLAFDLRKPAADEEPRAPRPSEPGAPRAAHAGALDQARAAIARVYGKGREDVAPREVKDLYRTLERLLGERGGWPTPVARAIFDAIAEDPRARRRSADHERLFWQIAGFAVRPGFGDPLDPARVAKLAPLFAEKLAFPETRSWQAFFVALRRAAGGLDERAQVAIRDVLDPLLAPAERRLKKPKGWPQNEARDEVLELASLLERVPPPRKTELGGWILERTWTERDPRLWAALGRLGARAPAYGSAHQVVSPMFAEGWLDHLLREKWAEIPTAPRAAAQLARLTGDRARDVAPRVREEVARRLDASGAGALARSVRELVAASEDDRAAQLGDALPPGLRLVE